MPRRYEHHYTAPEDKAYRESLKNWPPKQPRSLKYPPMLIRLASDWRVPIAQLNRELSIWNYLDEIEARQWLADLDNPPKGKPPKRKK